MVTSTIYKLLDKLEMKVLKGVSMPLTPWVILNPEIIIDISRQIKDMIPNDELLDDLDMKISSGLAIPYTPWVIVNYGPIIHNLDRIRGTISKEQKSNMIDNQ